MRCRWWIPLAMGLATGCQSGNGLPLEPDLVPVTGKVTVQGEPLAGAVVTFLQVDEKGTLAVGETDENGNYLLSHGGTPGAASARYKVAVSYHVGRDGTVYGLAPRSALARPYGFINGKELIPEGWSDLGSTDHFFDVPEGGGVIDIDVDVPLLPPPPPEDEPVEGEPAGLVPSETPPAPESGDTDADAPEPGGGEESTPPTP